MAGWDRARFYQIPGVGECVSVTSALDIIAKPALVPWSVNQERDRAHERLLTVLTRTPPPSLDAIWDEMEALRKTPQAHLKASKDAAAIGTAAHAYIEWRTKQLLRTDAGPEPVIPDAARLAVMAWEDWAKAVDFMPIFAERVVYHARYGYAGTLDVLAWVKGVATVIDWKTGRAVYSEAFLQNIAYRAALASMPDMPEAPAQGLILRLPKTLDDPAFEPVWVPEDTPLSAFLAALELWRWHRRATGQKVGMVPA